MIYCGFDNASNNSLAYTAFNKQNYYTMTPGIYSGSSSMIIINYGLGYLISSSLKYYSNVKPVINLKADVEITGGIGTINDPYIVKTT